MPCQQTVCGGRRGEVAAGAPDPPTTDTLLARSADDAKVGNNIARLAHTHSASSSSSSLCCVRRLSVRPNGVPRAGGPINLPLYKAQSHLRRNGITNSAWARALLRGQCLFVHGVQNRDLCDGVTMQVKTWDLG